MPTQTISLVISAKDLASSTLSKIGATLGGLNKQGSAGGIGGIGSGINQAFSSAQKSSQGLLDDMTMSVVKANLIGQAFNFAGGAIGSAKNELEKMSSIQLESLSSANSLAQVGKISLSQSSGVLDDMSKELSQKAASWVGETSDYLTVLRVAQADIARGSKINGKLMVEDFKKNTLDIVGDYTAIGKASGQSSQEIGLFLKRLTGGASSSELNSLSFGMNNPLITQNLTQEMQKLGVSSMEQLSASQRIAVIAAVGKKGNSPEMQKAASNTIDGLLQGFKSSLFDPNSGYFGGVFRKLETVPGQSVTVTEAFNKVLKELIGDGGLVAQITKTFAAIGLDKLDPMVALRNALDGFTAFTKSLTVQFQGINAKLAAGASIGSILSDAIANVANGVSSAFAGSGARAAELVNKMVAGLLGGASSMDYGAIVGVIGKGLSTFFGEVFSFLSRLSPQTYLAGAGLLIAGAIGLVLVAAIGGLVATIGAAIVGLGAPVILTIAAIGLGIMGLIGLVGDQIGSFFGSMFRAVVGSIGQAFDIGLSVIAATMPGIYLAGYLFSSFVSGLISLIQSGSSTIGGLFNSLFSTFGNVIGAITSNISTFGQTVFNIVKTLFDTLTNWFSGVTDFVKSNPLKQGVDGVANFVNSDPLKQGVDTVGNLASQGANAIGGFLSGHFQGGHLGALDREDTNSTGVPVIANSSEAIFTPGQLKNMMAGIYSSGQQGGGSQMSLSMASGAIVINGASDPEETARQTLQQLEDWLGQYSSGFLGAG